MFTLSAYGVYFSPKLTKKSPLRIVSDYEIELFSATGATGYLNGKAFEYPLGQVCVFRPGEQRQSKGQFSAYYLKFSCDQPELCKYLDKLPTIIPPGDTKPIYQLYHDIFNAMSRKQPGYKLYVYAKLAELISLLYSYSNLSAPTGGKYVSYTAEVYEAIRFMKEHMSEHITLEDVAGSVHLSPSFFHVVFKEIMQKTPHRYLLEMRLSEAKNLLINSNFSLTVIAEQCGFDSQVYFNYIIKKELGITPKKYRDSNRNRYYSI